jgi:hypothetical protein
MMKRFILGHQSPSSRLLVVGKSLGARNIVEVLNGLSARLKYKSVGLITIDPNWPLWSEMKWRPNLNGHCLDLIYPVDMAVNIYAKCPMNEQAGSKLRGSNVRNVELDSCDHHTIVFHPLVAMEITDTVKRLIIKEHRKEHDELLGKEERKGIAF